MYIYIYIYTHIYRYTYICYIHEGICAKINAHMYAYMFIYKYTVATTAAFVLNNLAHSPVAAAIGQDLLWTCATRRLLKLKVFSNLEKRKNMRQSRIIDPETSKQRVSQGVYMHTLSTPLVWDTHYQLSMNTLLSKNADTPREWKQSRKGENQKSFWHPNTKKIRLGPDCLNASG